MNSYYKIYYIDEDGNHTNLITNNRFNRLDNAINYIESMVDDPACVVLVEESIVWPVEPVQCKAQHQDDLEYWRQELLASMELLDQEQLMQEEAELEKYYEDLEDNL